jgi:hypothetical protein
MKNQHLLKPLTFAVALALSAAALADGQYHRPDGANASVEDTQTIEDNSVENKSTQNDASVNGALDFTGNTGVNVVSGDGNQQANAAAIATADSMFVFGYGAGVEANASIGVYQDGSGNTVDNYGTQNTASLTGDLSSTGNLGVNIASGNFNQQKNDLAIANSETAFVASASVEMEQTLSGNEVSNEYGKIFEGDDGDLQASNSIPGFPFPGGGGHGKEGPVVNNASLTGNVVTSGNTGINIAAGSNNQQANALSIAAGCTACAAQQ